MTAVSIDAVALPKAELHLHVEGTLEPELAFELARRNSLTLPFVSAAELAQQYRFENLPSFLDLYYATMAVLRTEDDFAELTAAYLHRASAQGVRHAEIFFDPQAHTSRGVPIEAVIDGITAGMTDAARGVDLSGGLIMCFLRDRPVDEADQTLTAALGRSDALIGVGLDSAEVGHPAAPFAPVFSRARAAGLHAVAHAGEEGSASSILEALDALGAERIDHGIRALDDSEVVLRLVRERIPLTVCPVSNVRLRVVESLQDHPLVELARAGVLVTVNSDDPAYFGGDVGDVMAATRDALGLADADLLQFARNSIDASFASASRKAGLRSLLSSYAVTG